VDAPVVLPALVSTPEASPAAPALVVTQLWDTGGGPDTPLDGPYGMSVAPEGNLWVVDANNGRFQIFAPDGTFLETWGTEGSGEGQFNFHPFDESVGGGGYGDIAFDREGNIYVADTGNFRIQKFGPDRAFLRQWGSKGTGDGQFMDVLSVAIGPDGNVYAADENRNDVQRFDPDGHFLNTIGEKGAGEGQMIDTEAVAIDASNTVWVADFASPGGIERFTPDGKALGTWRHDEGDGQLSGPVDLAFDAAGRVWVVDINRARVLVYTPDGRYLTAVRHAPTEAHLIVGFPGPVGLALGPDGHVYVGDWFSDFVTAFQVQPPAAPTTEAPVATPPARSEVIASPVAGSQSAVQALVTPPTVPGSVFRDDTVLLHGVFDAIPQAAEDIPLYLDVLDPGAVYPRGKSENTGVGPWLYRVKSGALTIQTDGPMTVTRAGSDTPVSVAPGTEIVLNVGDMGQTPTGVTSRWSNEGSVPVQILDFGVTTLASAPPPGVAQTQMADESPVRPSQVSAPITVTVRRVTVDPGMSFTAADVPGLELLQAEIGKLVAVDAVGAGTPENPFDLRTGTEYSRSFPPGREFRNASTDPVTLLLVTFAKPEPPEAMPMA
jgi:streptogramin lyase